MRKPKTLNYKKLKEIAESYRTTVNVLLCFLSLTTWEGKKKKEGFKHSFGRRMETSATNRISKETEITPDLVIQVSENESYITEAKTSLPKDKSFWKEEIEQLQKYDDDLLGWWTPNEHIKLANNVLLIEIAHSKNFSRYTDSLEKENGALFVNPSAYIEYTRSMNTEDNIFFRIERGEITNKVLNAKLSSGMRVPLEDVVISYGHFKFYDHKPEPEYLMEVLWSHLFNNMKDSAPFDDKKRVWTIQVNIPQVTLEIQKLFGHQSIEKRERCFPQKSWVREALDHLVAMKYGIKIDIDNYNIFYKTIKSDLLERFNLSRKYMKEIEEKKKQISLKLV